MAPTIKILIAEHDPIDLELLHDKLEEGDVPYISRTVFTELDYIDALTHFVPDIILSDYTFPAFAGPKAFALREQLAADTPFIFISGTIGEERSVELIKSGVTDCCLKDNLINLNHKISRALQESAVNHERKKMEGQLLLRENRLERAQHVAHIGHWDFNFHSKDFRCSEEIFRIYGLVPEGVRLTIRSFLNCVHPDDLEAVFKFLRTPDVRPEHMSATFQILNARGESRHAFLDCKAELDIKGMAVGMYGILHDVTENVLSEKALATQRLSRMEEITEAMFSAQETERAEIEKELQENVNQILVAAKLFLELAKQEQDRMEICLDKATGCILSAIEQIRMLSRRIVIPDRRIIGFFDSIKSLTTDFSRRAGWNISFNAGDADEHLFTEKLQLNMYRIIQEQLNNILKHANASIVSVAFMKEGDEMVLLVTDNGNGCDMTKKVTGMGIRNIRSRAALCHGSAEINSNPGEGFQLKLKFTINSKHPAELLN